MRRTITLAILLLSLSTAIVLSVACSDDDDSDADAPGTVMTDMHDEGHSELADAEVDASLALEMQDFKFAPSAFEVNAGEVVEITFSNTGAVTHDFTIDEGELDSLMMGEMEMVEGHSDAEHSDAYALHVPLEAGHEATLRLHAEEPGEYVIYCTVPGHRELGMEGTLTVR